MVSWRADSLHTADIRLQRELPAAHRAAARSRAAWSRALAPSARAPGRSERMVLVFSGVKLHQARRSEKSSFQIAPVPMFLHSDDGIVLGRRARDRHERGRWPIAIKSRRNGRLLFVPDAGVGEHL